MRNLLRRHGNAAEQTGQGTGDPTPEALRARLDELVSANRRERSLEREREILRVRHRLGAALVTEDRPSPEDPVREFGDLSDDGLAIATGGTLDGALVRGGILEHGYVMVPQAIPREDALRFADRIEEAFTSRASKSGDGLYEEFEPEAPYGQVAGRAWITAGGGLLAADSPPLAFELLELFESAGLPRVIAEFLGEPATISIEKTTLRRADPGPAGGWHQDGSFMLNTRALNVWFALSDCGVDAPGLDFVPARIDQLVETGTEGSGAEHLDRPDDDSVTAKTVLVAPNSAEAAAGEKGVKRPAFSAGDLMLFDDLFLHRTGAEPEMTKPRYAIEGWFFGASGFPRDYTPLAV